MVLKEKGTRFCRGGKVFTVGGRVLGNEACDYAGLHGVITGIYTGADGVVGLDAPEICCDFERPVSEEMIRDLEDRFSDICGEPTTIDDILFDMSVLRILSICRTSTEDLMAGVLRSMQRRNLFSGTTLSRLPITETRRNPESGY